MCLSDASAAQVFMLSSDALLDANTMKRVLASGHSRVPVHRAGSRYSPCSSYERRASTLAARHMCMWLLERASTVCTVSELMGALGVYAETSSEMSLGVHSSSAYATLRCMQEGHHRVDTGEGAGNGEL